jgi:hypothetical protein
MTHIQSNVISRATDDEMRHLESCERCRSRIGTDVDLGSVRDLLLSEATTEPRSATPRETRSWHPWLVGVGAAVIVLALFVPLLLLDNQPASDSAATSPIEPVTTIPALPPDLSGERPDPPTPPAGSDAESFEMAFRGADGVIGRLIWASPNFHEGLRITVEGNPSFDYSFYQGDGYGYNDGAFDPFPKTDDGHPDIGALPEDPAVPWAILLEKGSIDEMWTAIGGTSQPAPSEVTHPLADSAFTGEEIRLEVSEKGVPVLVQSPTIGSWHVTSLQHRRIRAGEVGNNADLPFNYALYLAGNTSDEQRTVIGDGMVTFADYQKASAQTADCAGVEANFDDATGLFSFNTSPQLEACRAQHLNDIEEIWRIDSQFLDDDEFVILWHTAEGELELAEMYRAKPGPQLPLASGPGWAISVWERGEGLCMRASAGSTGMEGCNLPSGWHIPEVLYVSVGITHNEEDKPISGEITGLVADEVTRVLVTFESGDTIEIIPGETTQLGVRGFGLASFDAAQLGEPTTIEVFTGTERLGTYSHQQGRPLEGRLGAAL